MTFLNDFPFFKLAILLVTLMTFVWLIQRSTKNANAVDATWALSFTPSVWLIFASLNNVGVRQVGVALLMSLWSLRLGYYLLKTRVLSNAPEDKRYARLRNVLKWNQFKFFVMYMFQALLVMLCSIAPYGAMNGEHNELGIWGIVGLVVGLGSIVGESIADSKLVKFVSNSANRGRTCKTGLWRYSRHPNYFFEWMHWWAYVFLGLGQEYFYLTLIGPVVMGWFLWKVTGIAASEKLSLKSRMDYAEYQSKTSAFFPWPPKS